MILVFFGLSLTRPVLPLSFDLFLFNQQIHTFLEVTTVMGFQMPSHLTVYM